MKIYIDAGHGGSDPGAVSGSMRESELNLKAALACREFLSAYNCQVIMSRTTDVAVPVQNRYKQAIAEMVDAVLCIHHNAGGGDGGEVWFWHTDNRAKELARLTAQEYKAIGQNLRTGAGLPEGTKACKPDIRQNFGMCREPAAKGIPAILGEFAFVDNATDRQIVDTDAELAEQGKAYGRAVVKFLGLNLKTAATPPVVPTALGYVVQVAVRGYNTAANAKARLTPATTVAPGEYGVFREYNGMLNVTKKAGVPGSWINPADNIIVNVPSIPTIVPVAAAPKAGDVFNLTANPLYISATAKVSLRKLTGTYYLYDGKKVNGRYRITNSKSRVNKTPAAFNVTGWVVL